MITARVSHHPQDRGYAASLEQAMAAFSEACRPNRADEFWGPPWPLQHMLFQGQICFTFRGVFFSSVQ